MREAAAQRGNVEDKVTIIKVATDMQFIDLIKGFHRKIGAKMLDEANSPTSSRRNVINVAAKIKFGSNVCPRCLWEATLLTSTL